MTTNLIDIRMQLKAQRFKRLRYYRRRLWLWSRLRPRWRDTRSVGRQGAEGQRVVVNGLTGSRIGTKKLR